MLVLPHTPCARDHTTFGPPEFIPSATYAPQGSLASAVLSVYGSFAGITVTSSYNKRLQPVEIKASSSAGTEMDLTYNFSLGAGDNGNVMSITNNLNTARSQAFSYDALNRLVTSQTSGTAGSNCFGFQFGYDQWANLKSTSVLSGYTSCTATTPYAFGIAVGTNNRVTTSGFGYDLSGNLTSDGINAYTWNAESETKTAAGVTYIYDGDGNRVEKSNGTLYWYGLGGEVLTETNLSGGLKADYVYFDGKRIAKHNGSGNNFYLEDHLGSSRVMTTSTGAVCYDADFLPYGQEVDYTNTCAQNYKFEGKERDTETGNDNFGARYYRSLIGRWQSPDWSAIPTPVPYANLTNPQTLNLYAMTRDNPESFADLDGHQEDPELVDPKVEEIENKESETLLEKAAGALTSAMQEKQSDDFDRFMAQHPDGWEDPLTGACYAPRSNTPTMNARPGTLGKPDHQQTANEEAAARAPR